jgi:hypothetical protein
MNRWTKTQKEYAKKQGWGIFAIDGDQNCLAIQKDDEEDIFNSNAEAINFVIKNAELGDMVCKDATKMIFDL